VAKVDEVFENEVNDVFEYVTTLEMVEAVVTVSVFVIVEVTTSRSKVKMIVVCTNRQRPFEFGPYAYRTEVGAVRVLVEVDVV
jgi:hypothetical protein